MCLVCDLGKAIDESGGVTRQFKIECVERRVEPDLISPAAIVSIGQIQDAIIAEMVILSARDRDGLPYLAATLAAYAAEVDTTHAILSTEDSPHSV